MSTTTVYAILSDIAKIYNELVDILPNVAAHTKKFQFAMSQFHQFLQYFSQTATEAPVTQLHLNAYNKILDFASQYQQLFAAHYLQCWAHSVLQNPSDYVPTLLCQIATGLQEATMDLDPVGSSAFDSAAPQWIQYHILDLKAIDYSLQQYLQDPNADKQVIQIVNDRLQSFREFIQKYEGKSPERTGVVFSPIPLIYQSWRLLATDFIFGQEVGQGVSAHVYLGRMKKTGEQVAIKALKFTKLEGEKLDSFQRELSILASAHHECLLRFVGATDIPPFCIVTEWMPGSSLYYDLNTRHSLSETDRSIAMFDIARGMKFLHSRRIIHRDLKSLNVLIDGNKRTKISDFGLSRVVNDESTLTNNIGTPHWMAPELLGQNTKYDTKVDVYAYAIVLWEICSQHVPYQGLMAPQIIGQVLVNDMRPPMPSNASPALRRLIKDCWQRDPERRPSFIEIVKRFEKGDIYIEGTNVDEYRDYVIDAIERETGEVSKKLEKALESRADAGAFATFLEENGASDDKLDECWSAVCEMTDNACKARGAAVFLETRFAQQAAKTLRAIPPDAISKHVAEQIIDAFPSGDEEADTSLFVCACRKGFTAQVLLRAVSPQHIKVGFELIARQSCPDSQRRSVVEMCLKYVNDADLMLRASAIRCLSKLGAITNIPSRAVFESLKSQEPTLVSVAVAALCALTKTVSLPTDVISDLVKMSDSEPLACLALANACSNFATAKEIVANNVCERLNPIVAANLLIKTGKHTQLTQAAKLQLEKICSQIRDAEVLKSVKASMSSM